MFKWGTLLILAIGALTLYVCFLKKVEETVYSPFEVKVGGKEVLFRCVGAYTKVRPKVVKGPPYRINISVSSSQPDEIILFRVASATIVPVNNMESTITLPDISVKNGREDVDKAYYWTVLFSGLILPKGEAHLRCEISFQSKAGDVVRKEVDWLMAPVSREYYVNTIVEAVKGL